MTAKDTDSGIFEVCQPHRGRCSVCGSKGGRLTFQDRPTGPAGKLWRYSLCPACIMELQDGTREMEICLMYRCFVEWIVGGKFTRQPHGCKVARIEPKKALDRNGKS